MATVPEALKALGCFAALGDEAGIDDQGLFMLRRYHLGNCHLVERDKVKVSGTYQREKVLS